MPLPSGLTQITLTGSFPTIGGGPQDGTVTFDPGVTLRDAAGHVILDGPAVTQVRASIMVPVTLPATDNTGLVPGPGTWAFLVSLHLGGSAWSWTLELPSSLAPTADLSALLDI